MERVIREEERSKAKKEKEREKEILNWEISVMGVSLSRDVLDAVLLSIIPIEELKIGLDTGRDTILGEEWVDDDKEDMRSDTGDKRNQANVWLDPHGNEV